MLIKKITTTGNSAALALSQDLLALMGVSVGDEVELQLMDRTLIVRPVSEAGRDQQVAAAVANVVGRRKRLLHRLAGEAAEPKNEEPSR